ncbi:hypothetical protein Tco_1548213 [Tanacetum coccineum]
MAPVNDVPQLVDKKGGSYAAIAPKLEPGKFNKWKKRMLCYLAGMEPYYIKCIKDGPFQPKTAKDDAKPESLSPNGLPYEEEECGRSRQVTWTEECCNHTQTLGLVDFLEVAETFDWDEEEVSDEEEVNQVKVLMALADDELNVRKSHARNGDWVGITIRKVNTLISMDEDADWQNYLKYINIDFKFVKEQRLNLLSKYIKMVFILNKCRDELLILKQAKLDADTFQIQNTELTKLNHALQEQLKKEKKINEKWLTSSKKVSQCISEQIPHQKKKVLGSELLTKSLSKININENAFIPASMGHDQEMVPKTKD